MILNTTFALDTHLKWHRIISKEGTDLLFAVYQTKRKPNPDGLYDDIAKSFAKTFWLYILAQKGFRKSRDISQDRTLSKISECSSAGKAGSGYPNQGGRIRAIESINERS